MKGQPITNEGRYFEMVSEYILFPLGSLSPSLKIQLGGGGRVRVGEGAERGGGERLVQPRNLQYTYDENQSNRASDFRDFVCSLFLKVILFDFYKTLTQRHFNVDSMSLM